MSDSTRVYLTNGKELKECMAAFDDAIVFIWQPYCHGQFCYSLNALQERCSEKHIELYIVAEYYDNAKMKMNYTINRPIYGIDTKYYKTNLTSKYLSKFLVELTGTDQMKGNFVRFKKGEFSSSFKSIEEL